MKPLNMKFFFYFGAITFTVQGAWGIYLTTTIPFSLRSVPSLLMAIFNFLIAYVFLYMSTQTINESNNEDIQKLVNELEAQK